MPQRGIHSPYATAAQHYIDNPGPRSLEVDVHLHLAAGYVIGTPWLFAMVRPVDRYGNPDDIVNPSCVFDDYDCWHIYFATGEIAGLVKWLPYHLPWISYERGDRLEFRKSERFLKLCQLRKLHSS